MSLWRRGADASRVHRAWRRIGRVGWVAVFAVPLAAVAVVSLLVSGTFAQLTATITNPNNEVQTERLGPFFESQDNMNCPPAAANGQPTPCDIINKLGGGTLETGATRSVTVTLHNTGDVPVRLFLLPSVCTDNQTGAGPPPSNGGELCGLVTLAVSCINNDTGEPSSVPGANLIDFFTGRNFATGYAIGEILPPTGGNTGTVNCTFNLTAGNIPSSTPPPSISMPLAWMLRPVPPPPPPP